MADKIVGSIPDFTSDEGVQQETEELKETTLEVEEKETPADIPPESVITEEAEQKPVENFNASLSDSTCL